MIRRPDEEDLLSMYQQAFHDAHWTVDEMLTTTDTVITRWTGQGTHTADLRGLAPTGKRANVGGVWIHRLAGDRIVESWNV